MAVDGTVWRARAIVLAFVAGKSRAEIASAWELDVAEVDAALRWELLKTYAIPAAPGDLPVVDLDAAPAAVPTPVTPVRRKTATARRAVHPSTRPDAGASADARRQEEARVVAAFKTEAPLGLAEIADRCGLETERTRYIVAKLVRTNTLIAKGTTNNRRFVLLRAHVAAHGGHA